MDRIQGECVSGLGPPSYSVIVRLTRIGSLRATVSVLPLSASCTALPTLGLCSTYAAKNVKLRGPEISKVVSNSVNAFMKYS
jgi:hypothetical protein